LNETGITSLKGIFASRRRRSEGREEIPHVATRTDKSDIPISANLHRPHLTSGQKRELIEVAQSRPEYKSDRQIAKAVKAGTRLLPRADAGPKLSDMRTRHHSDQVKRVGFCYERTRGAAQRSPRRLGSCRLALTGTVNENVDPFPRADSTQILPPCISMMRLGQAKAGAAFALGLCVVRLLELFEYFRLVRLGNPWPAVPHRDAERTVCS
jgi:hypothetical protein